jgi:hypothetical protein
LINAGWVGKVGGIIFVGLNLALVFAVTAGFLLAGGGSMAAAWTVFVLTIPFMVFVLPYFMGVALVGRGERSSRKHTVTTEVTMHG